MKRSPARLVIIELLLLLAITFGFSSCDLFNTYFGSDVNDLQTLTVMANSVAISLTPGFNLSIVQYTAQVDSSVQSVDVIAVLKDSTATMMINGLSLESGTSNRFEFAAGSDTLTLMIVVTSQTKKAKTYTVTITRSGGGNQTNPPNAPTITAVEADSQVTVSWDAVSGADSYNLYYRKDSTVTKSNGTKKANQTSPAVVSGLTNGSEYAFIVTAVNSAGESGPSNTATATPTQASAPPSKPSISQATAGVGQVTLTWTAITGATKYNVYYKVGSTVSKTTYDSKLANATSPCPVTGLTNGTQYAFILTAENPAGESADSNVVTATPQAPPPPAVPSNLHATAVTESTITLSWNTVTDASGYRMYRSLSAGGTFTKTGADVTSPFTSFQDTGLTASTLYYYKVSAFNATGQESAQSAVVSQSTSSSATQKPQTPSNLHVTAVTESSVSLAWSGVSQATEYRVYRSPTSGGTYTKVGTIDDPTDTEFIDTGLTASTTYYYTVTAYNSAGESNPSALPVPAVTSAPAQQIPAVPTGLRVTNVTDISVDLAWDSTANASGYRLYRSLTSGGTFSQVGTDIFSGTSFSDGGLPSTTYYYKVSAFNNQGESAMSTPAVQATTTAPPLQPPATPANLHRTTVTDSSVNMTWNAVANADGYRLYRSGSSTGGFLQVGPDLTGISYTDNSVTASTTYYYEVSAFNSAGESPLSTPAYPVTTAAPPLQPPVTPTGFHFGAVTDKAVDLLWDSMANASGYRIYKSGTSGGQYNQVGTDIMGATSYQDSNLTPQTTYYYRASAFNSAGESAMSTPPVQVTTLAPALQPPVAPANLRTTSITDAQVNLAWDAATNASGYRLYRSGSSSGPFTQIGADQSATTYQDGSVSALTTYYYAVSAFNSAGSSAQSTPALAVTTPAPPLQPPAAAPANLHQTTSTLTTVSLAWNTVTGATWYQLYRDGSLIYSDSATAYMDQGLASGTTYQYAVEAWNNAGGGPRSANVSGTTQTAVSNHAPYVSGSPNPSNGAVNVVLNVTVSWVFTDPDGDSMSYRFYYRPESQGTFNGPFYTQTTASYALYGLALGVKCYWYAEADDGRGGVGTTPIYSFTARGNSAPQVSNPNPPDGATNAVVSLTLGWSGSDPELDTVTYQVFVSKDLGLIDQASNKIYEGTDKSVTIPYQLDYGTLYYWKVVATDPFLASSYGLYRFSTQPPLGSPTLSLDKTSVSMVISSLQPAPGYVVVTATAKKADGNVDTLTVVDTTNQNVAHGDIHGLQIWVYSGSQKGTADLTVHSSSGVTAKITVTVYDSIIQIIAQ